MNLTDNLNGFFYEHTVFDQTLKDYGNYRIPALIKAKNGDILAFCEGREIPSDYCNIDILMRRSCDNGKSWSKPVVVAENGAFQAGNPSPLLDMLHPEHPNRIWLAYNIAKNDEKYIINGHGVREIMMTYSDDNGYTWTSPENITKAVSRPFQTTDGYHYTFKEDWRWYAIGPGHAIQLQQPPYRGRLLFPCNHIEGNRSYDTDYSHVFYSDDFGKTWRLGGCVNQPRTNECMAVELSNGDVMLNCRRIDGQTRYAAISHNGGETWEQSGLDLNLPDPGCQGSILRFTFKDRTRLLFCNAANADGRKHLTVKMSYDEGKTWTVEKQICDGFSAYSDMVIHDDYSIGIFYEAENYSKMNYCCFNLEWLTDNANY